MRYTLYVVLANILTLNAQAQNAGDSTACPCCTEYHRQFTFWAGNWEAFRPDGTLAGTNRITLIQDSCILREEWRSAKAGYTGTSYNYFDTQDNTWNQLWIDNQGGHLKLKGHYTGQAMVLYSDTTTSTDGGSYIDRITWTPNPDGSVRQLWERDDTRGKWTVLFDGLYRRTRQ